MSESKKRRKPLERSDPMNYSKPSTLSAKNMRSDTINKGQQMNTNDLYLEYARVIQMCKGTELEDTPWACVRWRWKMSVKWFDFSGHPNFSETNTSIFRKDVDFAVAVLEGRPVFVGDVIYDKQDEYVRKLVVSGINDYGLLINGSAIVWRSWKDNASWTPPTPKRTFTLNGVELPCPVNRGNHELSIVYLRDCHAIATNLFCFGSECDARKVFDILANTLESAEKSD